MQVFRILGILEAWICFTFIRYTSQNLRGFKSIGLRCITIQKCKSWRGSLRTHWWFTWNVKKGHALRDEHLEHNVLSPNPNARLRTSTNSVSKTLPLHCLVTYRGGWCPVPYYVLRMLSVLNCRCVKGPELWLRKNKCFIGKMVGETF